MPQARFDAHLQLESPTYYYPIRTTKFACEYIFFFSQIKNIVQVINSLSSLTFSYVFIKQN